jgi:hypothetical protein
VIGDPAQRAELSSLIVNSLEEGGDESLKFSIMKSRAGRERRERERKPANARTQFAAAWSVGPVLTVLGMAAEMGLGFIRDRQRAGIDAAKAKGIYKGRPATLDRAHRVAAQGRNGRTAIATAVGCKRGKRL